MLIVIRFVGECLKDLNYLLNIIYLYHTHILKKMLRVFTILGLAAATTMAATQNQTTEADVSKFVNETLEYVQEIKQYSRA